jgi:NifU-like protein
MSFYPVKISERFHRPRFAGETKAANAEGADAAFSCGSVVRFSLVIDTGSKEILAARFRANGCGYMTAAADVLAEVVTGKKLVQLDGLHDEVIHGWLKDRLGEFPAARVNCAEACIFALHQALADFRARQLEEWKGESVLICTCFGVSEETIETSIQSRNLLTVDEVTGACNAGGGCGSCQPLIQDILDSLDREMI